MTSNECVKLSFRINDRVVIKKTDRHGHVNNYEKNERGEYEYCVIVDKQYLRDGTDYEPWLYACELESEVIL